MKIQINVSFEELKRIDNQAAVAGLTRDQYCHNAILVVISECEGYELRHDQLADKYSGLDEVFGRI